MAFTVGQTSDSMSIMAQHFHRWVSVWCLSLAGPTVAQLGVSLALTVSELRTIFFVIWHYVYILDCFSVVIHCISNEDSTRA